MGVRVPSQFRDVLQSTAVDATVLSDDGTFPNNDRLPVLHYRRAFHEDVGDAAGAMEGVFRAHDWEGCWRNGIFSYHHYHSTAHEVLGVAAGSARVQLGGPAGVTLRIDRGDVIVLPAGVAHKNLGAADRFLVVGAYPAGGRDWDLKRGRDSDRPEADRNIEQVELPAQDPVYGRSGPLMEHWDVTNG